MNLLKIISCTDTLSKTITYFFTGLYTNETRIRKILGQLGLTFSRSEIVELCKDVCKSTSIDKYLKDRRLFKKLEYGKYEIIL